MNIKYFHAATYIILDIWSAAIGQQNSACLIMPMLTSHMQSSEPAPVLDVNVCSVVAEQLHGPTEAVLGGQVEGGHTVNLVLVVHGSSAIQQEADYVEMTASGG